MTLINADKISMSYTEKVLLNNVNLTISDGEKIGIVGVNGTGKSTLLKILAKDIEANSGNITYSRNLAVSYLSQNPVFDDDMTALEFVLSGFDTLKNPKEYEAMTVLNKLGIEDFSRKLGLMSGGQKRRVAIAKALIFPCEVLILDEPTNHLDNDCAVYLEQYLAKYKGAIIMVTHDRYFLDRVSNRIVEVAKGNIYSYDTNYTGFLKAKAEREEMELASERKRKSILRTELEWLAQGAQGRGTKSRYRIERIDTIKDNALVIDNSKLELSSLSSRLGKQIIEIDNISKSFDGIQYIKDFSYMVSKQDRIGIVGYNGCGKSTLLKIILGEIKPDSGTVTVGQTVKIGYFSQEWQITDNNLRVIDYIKSFGENIETKEGTMSASKLLETFLFAPDIQYSQISRLSGGEKRRLYLLSILIQSPNILFFDEPTNDLDITTLSILEDYLIDFDGAVITVSHDRYFLDRVAEKIFAYEDTVIQQYIGGYSDYLDIVQAREIEKNPAPIKEKKQKPVNENMPKKAKFSYKEQREYDTIDQDIADLEEKIENIAEEITKNSSDYTKLQELTDQKEELEMNLLEKMDRWVYLNDLAEQING